MGINFFPPSHSVGTAFVSWPCYQQESLCQDPAGNWTTRWPPDYRKKTQTAVVWSCFPFIWSGQNCLARHSERGKKTRQTEEEVGRQHQGMDWPGVWQVPEGSGEQGRMEKTDWKIICGAPKTLAVKGLMMMMMIKLTDVMSVYTCVSTFMFSGYCIHEWTDHWATDFDDMQVSLKPTK